MRQMVTDIFSISGLPCFSGQATRHIFFFEPEFTWLNGASCALRALLSFAVDVCLYIERETNWKTPPSPSYLHEHFQNGATPLRCKILTHNRAPSHMSCFCE